MTAALLSAGDTHGIVVWVGGSLIAAAVIALCGFGIRAFRESIRTNRDVRTYVVPHFRPPTAEQIVDGAVDRTLPTRIGDLEETVSGHAARISRLEKQAPVGDGFGK